VLTFQDTVTLTDPSGATRSDLGAFGQESETIVIVTSDEIVVSTSGNISAVRTGIALAGFALILGALGLVIFTAYKRYRSETDGQE
jgi:hypothetical protein